MTSSPLWYIPFDHGLYLRQRGELEPQEIGMDILMIFKYWEDSSQMKLGNEEFLRRVARCPRNAWEDAWAMLKHCWEVDDEGYYHPLGFRGLKKEVTKKIEDKKSKARKAALKRWGKNKGLGEPDSGDKDAVNSAGNADASSGDESCNADALHPDQMSIPESLLIPCESNAIKSKSKREHTSKAAIPPCPHLDIIDIYHEILPTLPSVVKSRWSGSQAAKDLSARWREDQRHQSLDFWRAFFNSITANDWWMGKNEKGWTANLRWILKRSNFDKAIENWR